MDPRHGLWIALIGGMIALSGSTFGALLCLVGVVYGLVAFFAPLLFD